MSIRPWTTGLRGAVLATAAAALLAASARVPEIRAQEPVHVNAVTLSPGEATLTLDLAGDATRSLSLADGQVRIDGETVGRYEPGGDLERSWRALLREPGLLEAGAAERLADWSPPSDAGAGGRALEAALRALSGRQAAPALPETATAVRPGGGQVAMAPGLPPVDRLGPDFERLKAAIRELGSSAEGDDRALALMVHDDYAVEPGTVVPGALALVGGTLSLDGEVRGDVLVLGGTLVLGSDATIDGDLLQVGGDVTDQGGRVAGERVSLTLDLSDVGKAAAEGGAGAAPEIADHVLRIPSRGPGFFGRIARNVGRSVGGVLAVAIWLVALGLIGSILVYAAPRRLEVVADTVRLSFGRAFGAGLAGQLLVLPGLLVLVVGIVTWLVIPVYVLAVSLAVPVGYIAAAHAAGETLSLRRYDWIERLSLRRSNSYWYVWSGLAALLLPFAIAEALHLLGGLVGMIRGLTWFAACVLAWVAATAGMGGLILSRGGGRETFTRGADASYAGPEERSEAGHA